MVVGRMALLAQNRHRRHQQRVLIRAMGCVTVQTALSDRRVFKQERATFFRVTLVAGLVDRVRFQQGISQRTVRVVTVIAAHLSFRQRHVGAPVELQTDVLVTLRAGVADGYLGHRAFD